MSAYRLRKQADATCKQHEHDDGIKKARRLKVDLKVHYDPGENDDGTYKHEKPSDDRFAVEEDDADPEYQRNELKAERVVASPIPKAACYGYAADEHITARYRHREPYEKLPQTARSAADILQIVHLHRATLALRPLFQHSRRAL